MVPLHHALCMRAHIRLCAERDRRHSSMTMCRSLSMSTSRSSAWRANSLRIFSASSTEAPPSPWDRAKRSNVVFKEHGMRKEEVYITYISKDPDTL